eukprot:TRINITY_DN12280_c0_g1_i1.p1 TRINITY_DN12280_c0_g1~~TRINITY_DN12280_c0_g1_i1.p1  ORF type:complete len:548 (-),score=107.98 TRINITY_DN12280_c0_g1_i1:67-1710(-)
MNNNLRDEMVNLRNIIQTIMDDLGVIQEDPSYLHGYCINLSEKQEVCKKSLDRMKQIVLQFQEKSRTIPAVELKRQINKSQDDVDAQRRKKLKNVLGQCRTMATRYLETGIYTETISTEEQYFEKLRSCLIGMGFCENQTDSNMETETKFVEYEYLNRMFLRIEVSESGNEIISLNYIVHGELEQKLEYTSQFLTDKLREHQLLAFETTMFRLLEKHNYLQELQTRSSPEDNINGYLSILENDLITLHNTFDQSNLKANLMELNGILKYNPWQLNIYYYAPLMDLYGINDIEREIEKKNGISLVHYATVGINRTNCNYTLSQENSSQTQINITNNAVEYKKYIPTPNSGSGVSYYLTLTPSIPITIGQMKRILSIVYQRKYNPRDQGNILLNDILHNVHNQEKSNIIQKKVLNTIHQYVLNDGGSKGILVKQIPFFHVTHISLIFQYLRQQATYNELYTSCFCEETSHNTEATKSKIIEITTEAPERIYVLGMLSSNLVNIEINIELNGKIVPKYYCQNPPSDVLYLEKLLNASKSIPLTMYYLENK